MALFRKNKEAVDAVRADVKMANDFVAETKANMRANGFDLDQAVQQAQAAVQSGGANDLLAMSQRAAHLMNNGVEMPATVRTIVVGQQSMLTGTGLPVTVGVSVQPPAAVPYEAAAQQVMVADLANQLHEGAAVTVKVDPNNPEVVMVWGVTGAAPGQPAAPAGKSDRVGRLNKLQSLRAAGAISDAEFDQQKARILAE